MFLGLRRYNEDLGGARDWTAEELASWPRHTALVGDAMTGFIAEVMKKIATFTSPLHELYKAVFILSRAMEMDGDGFYKGIQTPHEDYPRIWLPRPTRSTAEWTDWWVGEDVPLNVIIPLNPCGMQLLVWPGSIKKPWNGGKLLEQVNPENYRVVTVPYGSVLVFRGDLVHAGMGYFSDNYRIHFYLHQPGRVGGTTPEDGTYIEEDFVDAVLKMWKERGLDSAKFS